MSDSAVTIELNPRERRLYDRLRERFVERVSGGRSGMRDVLLVLPDLTILLLRLFGDRSVPVLQKGIAMAGIAYVLSPIDLMPALIFGPVGLLDDLFVVAACLSRLLNHVHPDVVRRLRGELEGWAAELIPPGLASTTDGPEFVLYERHGLIASE